MGNCLCQSAGPNLFKSDWLAGVAKSHAGTAALLAEPYFCFQKVQEDWLQSVEWMGKYSVLSLDRIYCG